MKNAIEFVKNKMIEHENFFSVSFVTPIQDIDALAKYIVSMCCSSNNYSHNTGDYLWFNLLNYSFDGSYDDKTKEVTINFCVNYYSTKDEENLAVKTVNNILTELNVNNLSPKDKVRAIYNWISNNCTYDKETYRDVATYKPDGTVEVKTVSRNAMYDCVVNKVAVCQGFANTMFYICNLLGVPTRILQGHEMSNYKLFNHAWNIMEIDNVWYNTDSTAGVHYIHDGLPGNDVYDWLLKSDKDINKGSIKYLRFATLEKLEFVNKHPTASNVSIELNGANVS